MSTQAVNNPGTLRAYLISPVADNLMIGGASLITFVFYWLFVDKSASVYSISFTALALSYVVNWPHFLSSYELLYVDYRPLIMKRWSFFWAAVASPLLIVGIFAVGVFTKNKYIFEFMVQGMYLSVGWHYVKQIYGTALVTSAVQKRYFGKWEKVFILINLYSLWAMSWISINKAPAKFETDGIAYYSLNLPAGMLDVAYSVTMVTFVLVVAMVLRKYIKTGVLPATSSLICFATIYCWYLPVLSHPSFFYLIPFFHSLQYILFVAAYKRNHVLSGAKEEEEGEAQRFFFARNFWGFWIFATIAGVFAFRWIPNSLDSISNMGGGFGPTPWLFACGIFINVHHYFIDNVIWRGDNPYLRENLILASQKNIHP